MLSSENWYDFRFLALDAEGAAYVQVRKVYEGYAPAQFTSAYRYTALHAAKTSPVQRAMALTAAIAMDIALTSTEPTADGSRSRRGRATPTRRPSARERVHVDRWPRVRRPRQGPWARRRRVGLRVAVWRIVARSARASHSAISPAMTAPARVAITRCRPTSAV